MWQVFIIYCYISLQFKPESLRPVSAEECQRNTEKHCVSEVELFFMHESASPQSLKRTEEKDLI